jgi:hypothetical protein
MTTNAAGTSDTINLTGLTLCSIQMSTAWDAANIGFNANVDGSTNYYPVFDLNGNNLTFPTSASRVVTFDPAQFSGLQFIQLVSETSAGVAVAQTAARTIKLGLAEYVEAN